MSVKKIDALYLQGKGQEDSFAFYYANLRPLLLKYARTIGRSHDNQVEDHLIEEMVNDLLLDIGSFKGDSKLSTWAYVRFRRRFINEWRFQSKNLGESLEVLQEEWESRQTEEAEYFTDPFTEIEEPTQETDSILRQFRGRLTNRQQIVFDKRREGYTFKEIGETLGISIAGAAKVWNRVLELATEYGKMPV